MGRIGRYGGERKNRLQRDCVNREERDPKAGSIRHHGRHTRPGPVMGPLHRRLGYPVEPAAAPCYPEWMPDRQTLPDGVGRVVPFRHRRSEELDPKTRHPSDGRPQAPDGDEPDDYGHRMTMNIVVFLLVAGLIGGALWLANTMADMRKNQDCVLSGRAGCTPVDVPPRQRY